MLHISILLHLRLILFFRLMFLAATINLIMRIAKERERGKLCHFSPFAAFCCMSIFRPLETSLAFLKSKHCKNVCSVCSTEFQELAGLSSRNRVELSVVSSIFSQSCVSLGLARRKKGLWRPVRMWACVCTFRRPHSSQVAVSEATPRRWFRQLWIPPFGPQKPKPWCCF